MLAPFGAIVKHALAALCEGTLIVQDNIQQRAVNLQSTFITTRVMNEAQFPEPVHEKTHSRTSGADHCCQSLLADLGNHRLRGAFFAKMREHEKDACESFFAGVKQ